MRTSDPVIFEAAFTLQSFYKASREQIRDALLPLIDLPGIELPNKRVFRRVFALFVETSLSFADCYSAALMEQDGETVIYSFDRGYDRLQDKSAVRQAEPG